MFQAQVPKSRDRVQQAPAPLQPATTPADFNPLGNMRMMSTPQSTPAPALTQPASQQSRALPRRSGRPLSSGGEQPLMSATVTGTSSHLPPTQSPAFQTPRGPFTNGPQTPRMSASATLPQPLIAAMTAFSARMQQQQTSAQETTSPNTVAFPIPSRPMIIRSTPPPPQFTARPVPQSPQPPAQPPVPAPVAVPALGSVPTQSQEQECSADLEAARAEIRSLRAQLEDSRRELAAKQEAYETELQNLRMERDKAIDDASQAKQTAEKARSDLEQTARQLAPAIGSAPDQPLVELAATVAAGRAAPVKSAAELVAQVALLESEARSGHVAIELNTMATIQYEGLEQAVSRLEKSLADLVDQPYIHDNSQPANIAEALTFLERRITALLPELELLPSLQQQNAALSRAEQAQSALEEARQDQSLTRKRLTDAEALLGDNALAGLRQLWEAESARNHATAESISSLQSDATAFCRWVLDCIAMALDDGLSLQDDLTSATTTLHHLSERLDAVLAGTLRDVPAASENPSDDTEELNAMTAVIESAEEAARRALPVPVRPVPVRRYQ